jgi:hypothetical protein
MVGTNISEERTAINFRTEVGFWEFIPENGGSIFLLNVGIYVQVCVALLSRRSTSTFLPF